MTAQEARTLMPTAKIEEVFDAIKDRAKRDRNFTWHKLTEDIKKDLINLGYTVEYSSVIKEYRISW